MEESRSNHSDERLRDECGQRWQKRGFSTRLTCVNGVNLYLAEAGEGDPVLLLHGYPQSGEVWRFVGPDLASRHRVLIPDLRGMGLSDAAPKGYDLVNLAEDIHQLVASLGLLKVKVVGHDWGGAIGATYAMRYRDEVSHLVFIESAIAGAGFETLWDFGKPNPVFTFIPFLLMGEGDSGADSTVALLEGRESVFLRHLWSSFTDNKTDVSFESWAPYVAAMSRPGIALSSSSYYRTAYQSADQIRDLIREKLTIAVLAVAGEKGVGEHHEALVRAFANNLWKNLIIPGSGHFVAEERPEELSQALKEFLG